MSNADTLKRCELFVGLDDAAILKIAHLPSCQTRELAADEVIFSAGQEAGDIFMLEEGKISLVLKQSAGASHPPRHTVFRTITRGGIFGWGALVPPHIRVGSAISKGPSRVLSIGGEDLRVLFDEDPRIGYEVTKSLLRIIGSRVWNLEQLLVAGRTSPFV